MTVWQYMIRAADWIMPVLFLGFGVLLCRRDGLWDSFVRGAMEGCRTILKLLPTMGLLMTALAVFEGSGACAYLTDLITPGAEKLGIPPDLLPLILTRPLSGSASGAVYSSLVDKTGADSLPAFAAAIIMGSSDTLFYVTAVYFSGTRVTHTRHTIPAALAVSVFCVFLSCALARLFCP